MQRFQAVGQLMGRGAGGSHAYHILLHEVKMTDVKVHGTPIRDEAVVDPLFA